MNPLTPLFSTHTHVFSGPTIPSPASHAATSILLALGAQHLSRTSPAHLHAANYYFSITSRLLPTVLLSLSPCVLGIQSLIGMALYFQESDDVQPIFTLLGLSTGMATQLGLHRNPRKLRIPDPHEISQRINAWWVLYTLDKETALRTGRPSSITDQDCDVPLPTSELLLQRTLLAQIMSAALRATLRASELPRIQRQLEHWRKDTPLALRGCWEENAMTLRVRLNCFCTMINLELEVEAWAREEAKALVKWEGPKTKALLSSLAAAAWCVFVKRVTREGDGMGMEEDEEGMEEDEEGIEILEEIAEYIRSCEWAEGEGKRMSVLFLMLVDGMVELARRGAAEACLVRSLGVEYGNLVV